MVELVKEALHSQSFGKTLVYNLLNPKAFT
jgi:hypothetical protein